MHAVVRRARTLPPMPPLLLRGVHTAAASARARVSAAIARSDVDDGAAFTGSVSVLRLRHGPAAR